MRVSACAGLRHEAGQAVNSWCLYGMQSCKCASGVLAVHSDLDRLCKAIRQGLAVGVMLMYCWQAWRCVSLGCSRTIGWHDMRAVLPGSGS